MRRNASYIFTGVIILFPILSIYGIGLGTFTLGDFFLTLSCFICFLYRSDKISINISYLFFVIYIFINFIFIKAFETLTPDVTMRTLRYAFYVFVIACFVNKNFNYEFGKKFFYIICILSILMMGIQTLSWLFFHKYIQGYLPGLTILRDDLVTFSEGGKVDSLGLLRPRSFFGEPAHYCQYLLGYICFLLFDKKHNNYWLIGFFSLGIILSVSSTGILCLGFLLFIFSIKNWKKLLIYAPIVILILYFIYYSEYFQGFLIRMENGKSSSDRFAGYSLLFEYRNFFSLLFGNGMKLLEGDYLSGYLRLFYYFGITGVILFFYEILSGYKKHNQVGKILVWLFIVLNIGTEVALGPFLIIYSSFILTSNEKRFRYFELQ